MSAYDTTIAQMACHYALKHVQREIRKARLLSFINRFRRRLLVLEEHQAILLRREPRLGEGARRRVA